MKPKQTTLAVIAVATTLIAHCAPAPAVTRFIDMDPNLPATDDVTGACTKFSADAARWLERRYMGLSHYAARQEIRQEAPNEDAFKTDQWQVARAYASPNFSHHGPAIVEDHLRKYEAEMYRFCEDRYQQMSQAPLFQD